VTGSPDGSLKDKTVLVVGRGSGLARAIALAAVDAGAHVVAAGRNQETLPAAADTLARSLALELAPIRVNAISPGVIDTGAWDALGEQGKADYFADMSARNPARRIGTPEDIAQGVLFAMTSTFLTGQTLHIDGGEPLT
jgi:NAD(P)-dependent dehydrogenase (short-subunit alcohol dehydrogenase family)